MTARIAQQIVPRHRSNFRSSLRWTKTAIRTSVASRPQRRFSLLPALNPQRGSVSHGTITISLGFIALITVSLLGFLYLQQVVGTASQGSDIHALESSLVELKEQQRQLELEGAQLRSLKTIEDKVEHLNLVATEKYAYLNVTPDKVALSSQP